MTAFRTGVEVPSQLRVWLITGVSTPFPSIEQLSTAVAIEWPLPAALRHIVRDVMKAGADHLPNIPVLPYEGDNWLLLKVAPVSGE
jgi:hypothetical protein